MVPFKEVRGDRELCERKGARYNDDSKVIGGPEMVPRMWL
jgi:hypothetical protein